ncbi:hypothetical protein CYMTET_26027, partial [Cymbomonas tetramitiformis]
FRKPFSAPHGFGKSVRLTGLEETHLCASRVWGTTSVRLTALDFLTACPDGSEKKEAVRISLKEFEEFAKQVQDLARVMESV